MADQVDAEADGVRSLRPAGIADVGIDAVVALHRTPVIRIAEDRITRDVEDGEAALARIRTVGAGNLQHVGAVVRSEVGSLGVMLHSAGAEITVYHVVPRDYGT